MVVFIDGHEVETALPAEFETSLNLQEDNKLDWFEMHPKVFFNGKEIGREDVQKFLDQPYVFFDGRYYRIDGKAIPSLKWLDYFWSRLMGRGTSKGGIKSESSIQDQPRSEVLNMLALRRAGLPVIGGERWKRICQHFDELEEGSREERLAKQNWMKTLKVPLKEYQKAGVQWLLDHYAMELGGILADDMGLGKTVQFLSFLEVLRQRKDMGLCLAVVPTSLVHNWDHESKKFTLNIKTEIFEPNGKEDFALSWKNGAERLVIVTYGLLVEHSDFFKQFEWNVMVFDEGQYLKNISAVRTSHAREIKAHCKFALTGTPMENHFGEFYSLIDLVVPGALGPYKEFMSVYSFKPSESQTLPLRPEDIEFLRLKTQGLVLRRSKEAIVDELPDKQESEVMIDFEKQQKQIYRDTALSWNRMVQESIAEIGEAKSQIEMLTALLGLRQICSCPSLVPGVEYKQTSPKLELLYDKLSELVERNQSVLVFGNFKKTLEIVEQELTKRGLPCSTLTGDISRQARKKVLEEFESSPHAHILLMTLKVGGVGLNLTKANNVFHLEPWWNPSVENQATDRAHRLGQKRSVQVYRYIMESSVEEKIQTLKGVKHKAFEALFSNCESADSSNFNKSKLTQKDFEALLNFNHPNGM